MNNNIKHALVIGIAVAALNAKAGYVIGVGQQSSFNDLGHNVPTVSSGYAEFDYTFGDSGAVGGLHPFTPIHGPWSLVNFSPTSSGQSLPGKTIVVNNALYSIYGDGDVFSSLTIDATYTTFPNSAGSSIFSEGPTYSLVVDYTLNGSGHSGNIYFDFSTVSPGSTTVSSEVSIPIGVVAAVPEPGQALAGAVLLGCGALVFTGRRWIKAQAAK